MWYGDTFLNAKLLSREGNLHFKMGACGMNGKRPNMEDAHRCLLSLPNHPQTSYFALFDGHGGNSASNWAAEHLVEYLDQVDDLNNPNELSNALLRADHGLREYLQKGDDAGTTAVFVLASPQDSFDEGETEPMWDLTVGYVGDSRVLLVRKDEDEVEVLTVDHKPSLTKEFQRIRRAGGFVSNDRVDGDLAVSRALGDFSFKSNAELNPTDQKVICVPGVCTVNEVKEGDLIILICDGMYETMSNEQIAQQIVEELKDADNEGDLAVIASKLCELAGEDGTDNTSVMIVQLTDGKEFNRKDEFIPASQENFSDALDKGKWSFQSWLEMYRKFVMNYCNKDWDNVKEIHKILT